MVRILLFWGSPARGRSPDTRFSPQTFLFAAGDSVQRPPVFQSRRSIVPLFKQQTSRYFLFSDEFSFLLQEPTQREDSRSCALRKFKWVEVSTVPEPKPDHGDAATIWKWSFSCENLQETEGKQKVIYKREYIFIKMSRGTKVGNT